MMNINGKIATYILRAQNASDGGKHLEYIVGSKRSHRDNIAGYDQKDIMVASALRLITCNNSNFKFSVQKDKDGIAKYLVYFETRINGEKYQVSFHSFNSDVEKYIKNSFRMKWDKKDSRESALVIYSYYVKNGEYGGDVYD